ncbi:MAG TPA: hypothetical protein VGE74_09675 [Gemmata sp.]
MPESNEGWTVGNHDDWSLGYEGRGDASGLFILDAEGRVVGASLRAHGGALTPNSVEANAHLFKASPKLLAACEELIPLIRDSEYEKPPSSMRLVSIVSDKKTFAALDAMRKAINEAKGSDA